MRIFPSALKLVPVYVGVAALLAAPQALAQAYGFGGGSVILQRPELGLAGSGCPVLMTASQRSLARQIETGSAVPAGPAQGLTVAMTGLKALKITSAEVVAYGLSPKGRMVLTSREDEADVARSFHLVAQESGAFQGDLWMEGVTAIRWIEVRSLTYSNGSVWRASDTQRCVARPDPFLLISSAR